jgi:two-component system CheB/CheR fusion protein
VEKAGLGLYLDNIEIDVSPERLRRFFVRSDGHYQISKAVREVCVFSRHNLTADPPFSRLDLASCRNVLIDMDAPLQKRVMPLLHYALNPNGFLLLGTSESIGTATDLFEPVRRARGGDRRERRTGYPDQVRPRQRGARSPSGNGSG